MKTAGESCACSDQKNPQPFISTASIRPGAAACAGNSTAQSQSSLTRPSQMQRRSTGRG